LGSKNTPWLSWFRKFLITILTQYVILDAIMGCDWLLYRVIYSQQMEEGILPFSSGKRLCATPTLKGFY